MTGEAEPARVSGSLAIEYNDVGCDGKFLEDFKEEWGFSKAEESGDVWEGRRAGPGLGEDESCGGIFLDDDGGEEEFVVSGTGDVGACDVFVGGKGGGKGDLGGEPMLNADGFTVGDVERMKFTNSHGPVEDLKP